MNIRLWSSPYNGGWIWFDRRNLKRCSIGWNRPQFWGAIFGISWSILLQTWPWERVVMRQTNSARPTSSDS